MYCIQDYNSEKLTHSSLKKQKYSDIRLMNTDWVLCKKKKKKRYFAWQGMDTFLRNSHIHVIVFIQKYIDKTFFYIGLVYTN